MLKLGYMTIKSRGRVGKSKWAIGLESMKLKRLIVLHHTNLSEEKHISCMLVLKNNLSCVSRNSLQ